MESILQFVEHAEWLAEDGKRPAQPSREAWSYPRKIQEILDRQRPPARQRCSAPQKNNNCRLLAESTSRLASFWASETSANPRSTTPSLTSATTFVQLAILDSTAKFGCRADSMPMARSPEMSAG